MKIALASPPLPETISTGLYWLEKFTKEASQAGAELICFPESYIPGYPYMGVAVEKATPEKLQAALDKVCRIAAANAICIIVPMDWWLPEGHVNLAFVVSAEGKVLGYQTKNQLDPSEDSTWVPGSRRQIFEVNGIKFGIVICHEGFRYPETVRWAAIRDATVVFHPHCAGNNQHGSLLTEWGAIQNPYYEKAMMMRALENTIYFASTNYSFKFPESASSMIAPDGTCIAHETYGRSAVLVAEINPVLATGLLARRFKNELYLQ